MFSWLYKLKAADNWQEYVLQAKYKHSLISLLLNPARRIHSSSVTISSDENPQNKGKEKRDVKHVGGKPWRISVGIILAFPLRHCETCNNLHIQYMLCQWVLRADVGEEWGGRNFIWQWKQSTRLVGTVGAASTYLQFSSDMTYIAYKHLDIYNIYILYCV